MARGTFGLTSSRRARGSVRGSTHFRGSRGRGRGRGQGQGSRSDQNTHDVPAPQREDDGTQLAERFEQVRVNDEVDERLGFARVQEGSRREGWLVNMHPVRSV
jgi:DNA polymerase epsilon subunit 1